MEGKKEENTIPEKENKIIPIKEDKSPIKIITILVLLITALFFSWYVLSDRYTPYTDLVLPLI